jgi:hypothetical protein
VLSCYVALYSFVLINLEAESRDLGANKESPVAKGGNEAGMFSAGEDMPVSPFDKLSCSSLRPIVY